MQEKNSKKRNSLLIVIGLVLLIAIVVITSIVLNFKKQKLEDMEDQNQQIEDALPEEGDQDVVGGDGQTTAYVLWQ